MSNWNTPIARWKLDGNLNDYGPYGYNFTDVDGYAYEPGINGKAVYSGGSNTAYTDTYSNLVSGMSGNFTISYWLRTRTNSNIYLAYCRDPLDTSKGFYLYTRGEQHKLYLGATNIVIAEYTRGTWGHVTYVINRGATGPVYSYVNGKLLYSESSDTTATIVDGPHFCFGSKVVSGSFYPSAAFNANDLRIYDYALSTEDVSRLYNSYHGQYQAMQGVIV